MKAKFVAELNRIDIVFAESQTSHFIIVIQSI